MAQATTLQSGQIRHLLRLTAATSTHLAPNWTMSVLISRYRKKARRGVFDRATMVHIVYCNWKMTERSQQNLLQDLKEALGGTWDDVAVRTQIVARTLKSYRLPPSSKGYRGMDKFVRKAVEDVLSESVKKGRRRIEMVHNVYHNEVSPKE